jgi:predicted nucleic acid-binding protein
MARAEEANGATSLAHATIRVTANAREFRRVAGLRIEDWTT